MATSLGLIAAAALVLVILGSAIAVFFNPLWIGFEHERVGVPEFTGYAPEQVRAVTGSILADLLLGPPDFAIAIDGRPVLGIAERSHMVDVRNVLLPATAALGAAIAVLSGLVATNMRRAWVWRAIAL